MWARARAWRRLELGPPADHVDPVLDEEPEELLERKGPGGRPSTRAGMMTLKRVLEQARYWKSSVEDHVRVLPSSTFTTIRTGSLRPLVLDVGHAGDPVGVDQFGQLLPGSGPW